MKEKIIIDQITIGSMGLEPPKELEEEIRGFIWQVKREEIRQRLIALAKFKITDRVEIKIESDEIDLSSVIKNYGDMIGKSTLGKIVHKFTGEENIN